MIECEKHGLAAAAYCCEHIVGAMKQGAPLALVILFDDYGVTRNVCEVCRGVGLKHARELPPKDRLGDYPFKWSVECAEHLDEWYQMTSGEDRVALIQRERSRTGSRPERS